MQSPVKAGNYGPSDYKTTKRARFCCRNGKASAMFGNFSYRRGRAMPSKLLTTSRMLLAVLILSQTCLAHEPYELCPAMPGAIAERFHLLWQAYPEWNLQPGAYCFERQGTQAYWTWKTDQAYLYSPAIAWQGEISIGLAHSLQKLARDQEQEINPWPRRSWWIVAAAGVGFAIALWQQGILHQSGEHRL